MKAKPARELIPKTAKDCGVSEELTSDVVDFFYTKLRKKVETLEDPIINIPFLGKLMVNKRKLKSSITALRNYINTVNPNSFKRMKRVDQLKTAMLQQIEVLEKIKTKETERDELRKHLEESSSDS